MLKKITLIITLFVSVVGFAQKNNTSAYSFFGIGDKNNISTAEQLSMGGIGVTLDDTYHLNMSNPAAASSLFFTTYTLGIENKNITAKNSSDTQKAASTYLSYLAMGVPIGEKGGLIFGLLPNSSVGYSLVSNVLDSENNITEATAYEGEGGTNKVFLGFGYKPFKGFSVGLQGNYIFGKIENSIINQRKDNALATKYQTISNVTSFSLNTGFLYKTSLNKNLNLHLGASFDLSNTMDAGGSENIYTIDLIQGGTIKDTNIINENSTGTLKSPIKSSIGSGIGKENKWFTSVEYSFQNPIELQGDIFNRFSKIKYEKFSKIAVGGFYIPKFNSITSYWQRVTYRGGLKYEKTGLLVDALGTGTDFTPIDDFGISFGLGLPLNNQLSNVNLGFELGKRGKIEKGLVQENYFNFRLSFSFNDKWFKKLEIF